MGAGGTGSDCEVWVKVKVEYTVEVDDDIRRQINIFYGRAGLASRDEVKRWYEAYGHSLDDDLSQMAADYDERLRYLEEEWCGI